MLNSNRVKKGIGMNLSFFSSACPLYTLAFEDVLLSKMCVAKYSALAIMTELQAYFNLKKDKFLNSFVIYLR